MKKVEIEHLFYVVLIILTVAGILLMWQNRIWFGKWEAQDCVFESVVYASRDTDECLLVLDKSGERFSCVSKDNEIRFQGFSSSLGITEFNKVTADNNGNIYIIGINKNDTGRIIQEKIAVYSHDGQHIETNILCEYDTPKLASSIMGIYPMGSQMVVLEKKQESITLRTVKGEILNEYAYEKAYENIASLAIDIINKQLFAVQYNGKIISISMSDGSKQICYDSTYINKSVPKDISIDKDGTIYVTDIGTRECFILRGHERIEIDGWKSFTSNYGNDICYFIDASHGLTAALENGVYIYDGNKINYIEHAKYPKNMRISQKLELYSCVLLAICFLCYFVLIIYYIVRKASQHTRLAIVITIGTILVAGMVTILLLPRYADRILEATLARTQVASSLTASSLPIDALKTIKTPSDFDSENYKKIRDVVRNKFVTDDEWINDLYCTIYMVIDDVITGIYCIQEDTGAIYPYAWNYEGSDEQEIITTGIGKTYTSSSSEGNYLFTLNPIFDDNGEVVGLIEVGTDTNIIYDEISEILFDLLLNVAALIAVIILISIEILSFVHPHMNENTHTHLIPNNVLRLCVFLIFFVTNISTSFLPIYSMALAENINGIPKEIVAAIPISAEVVAGAVMSLLGSSVIRRLGVRCSSVVCSILIMAGFFIRLIPTIWMLILSNIVIGIGWGVVLLIINTSIAQKEDEIKDIGFADYSAAALNGVNCGVVFGGFMVGVLDYKTIFMLTGIFSIIIVLLAWHYFRNNSLNNEIQIAAKNQVNIFHFLSRKRIWTFLLMIVFPVIACGYYLNYMYPILGESYGLKESYIGYSYLLNGICVISLSTLLTSVMEKRIKKQYAMGIGVLIYAAAFFIVGTYQNIWVLMLSLIMLGIADSFALPMQTSYFTDLKEVEDYGYDKAIGVYSLFENTAQSAGSFIFGSVLLLGIKQGLYVMIGIIIGLAAVFNIIAILEKTKLKK